MTTEGDLIDPLVPPLPIVGDVVHYMARGSADGVFPPVCRAAIVTEARGLHIGACVLNPTGIFLHCLAAGGCHYDAGGDPGTWHWPDANCVI